MSYIESDLRPGESVILESRLTFLFFAMGALAIISGIPFIMSGPGPEGLPNPLVFLGFAIALWWMGIMWRFLFFEFSVTNRRVVLKEWALLKKTEEILLEKVESVKTEFSLIWFFFGYGTIIVTGSWGTKIGINGIPSPKRIRESILEAAEEARF